MNQEEIEKRMNAVRKRAAEGRVSRRVSYKELTDGNPSKERMAGRLEAYLQTGVIIDSDDLMKVIGEYEFSPEEYKHLIPLSEIGVIEGLVQEPNNMVHYGERMACLGRLASKFFGGEDE